jgi:hypothetical protein
MVNAEAPAIPFRPAIRAELGNRGVLNITRLAPMERKLLRAAESKLAASNGKKESKR